MQLKRLFVVTSLALTLAVGLASAQTVAVMALGDEGPFTAPALEFAEEELGAERIDRGDLNAATLSQFAVVWWHDGDTDPGDVSDAEIDALVDYAEAGGAVLLTGVAIRYATPMGLENAVARQFGPTPADGTNVGITVLDETLDLGLVDNLVNIDGDAPEPGDRVQVNSTGFPLSGDYFDGIWTNFTTLAEAWGPPASDWTDRIAAFGYWEANEGKVFNMNWRLPNFHANNEDIDQLHQLTRNVVDWLASESAFLAVDSRGKLPIAWAAVKKSG